MSTQKEGEGGKAVQPVSLQPVEKSTTPEFHQKDEKKQLVSPVLLENINALADQLAVYSRQRTGMQTSLEGQSVIRMPQKNGPTISDNRSFTVYQTITPSDPQQAADMSAKSFKDIAQIVTPGMNAPVVY